MNRVLSLLLLLCVPVANAEPVRLVATPMPSLPIAVSNNAVASVETDAGTLVYSVMGITDPDNPATITPHAYVFDGDTWERIADAPLFRGRAKIGASCVSVAGELYLVGGYAVLDDGSEVTEPTIYRHDRDADEWVGVTQVPTEVDDTAAGVWRDRWIVLVSGWHGPAHDNVPDVQLYDTKEDRWIEAGEIPGPLPGLFGHSGGVVGDRVVYFDGVRSDDGFRISDAVYIGEMNPDELGNIEWRTLDPHPGKPTYRAAAVTHDAKLLVLGGTDNPYNISGVGYDKNPSKPLRQALLFNPEVASWTVLEIEGDLPATMDHRALAPINDGFLLVGGMTAPGETTDQAWMLRTDIASSLVR